MRGKPAIGDGVLWTTCKRKAQPEAQLGDSRSRSSEPRRVGCGENPQVGYTTLDTHDAPLFAIGVFFFGAADFFSAKRLFFRAARDVSGVRSSPPWARVVIKLKMFSGFIPLAVPRKGFSPHIPAPRLFIHFHTSKPRHPTQPTIPLNLTKSSSRYQK